ncbi:MAG: hypothetical protein AB7L13_10255 [Acidimicrobiia bacterium]
MARINWRRLGVSFLFALGLALVIFGFSKAVKGDPKAMSDPAVEQTIPKNQDLVLRQSQVGVALIPGYTGILEIDGVRIPEDQLIVDKSSNLNTILFQPGKDTEFPEFRSGLHTVVARFWRVSASEAQSRSITWSFRVS